MYIWRVSKVVQELGAGELSQKEQLKYFVAFFALIVVGLNLPIDSDARGWLGRDGFFKWVAYVGVAVIGTTMALWVNLRGDRRQFISRFVALYVPLTIQSLCLVAIGLLLVSVIPDRLPRPAQDSLYKAGWFWDWYWFMLQVVAELLLFSRIAFNLKKVSNAT
jgi:hypothetical protein